MSNKFEDNLGLFPTKNRTSEKSPQFTGNVVLSKELLKTLVGMVKAGAEPKMRAACWVNEWQGGKRLSVKLEAWEERESSSHSGGNGHQASEDFFGGGKPQQQAKRQEKAPPVPDDFDDQDIPF